MVMASSAAVVPVLLALLLVLPLSSVSAADDDATHLHFFMHDVVSGSNPTAVQVIKGPAANTGGLSFGDTTVFDDALTETSSSTSTPVGRMQGVYMLSSQSGAVLMVTANILLTTGDFNGSTLAVMGRDDTAADVRELSVVGGTGKFRMASGYVQWKTTAMNGPDATVELDVHLGGGSNGTAAGGGGGDASDGGDGSAASGGGGGSSKPSSGASSMTAGAGWVVAVAAAVVGSCWVW